MGRRTGPGTLVKFCTDEITVVWKLNKAIWFLSVNTSREMDHHEEESRAGGESHGKQDDEGVSNGKAAKLNSSEESSSPLLMLNSPNSFGFLDFSPKAQPSRVGNFPHVEVNYAVHVYIPV
ncbi:hypothetical protein L3X38_035859 [Prunus dulcis]|uniref:Uncharacterized protein n=1 Tax=Prunus dulcis TaxID=3755 RepID=A0AAD4YZ84_PRUDU|nr:hypothetical protein L3X38_035859 [Prunus dulcis]